MQDVTTTNSADGEPKRPGQDEIDASKAPLMDHLVELRQRLIYAIVGVFLGFIVCFYFAQELFLLLVQPYLWAVKWATGQEKVKLIFINAPEYFFTQIKLALFGATCITFPNIAIQIYKFIAPGLYTDEKAAFRPYLIATPILFVVGALIVYFVVTPFMMYFFVKMQVTTGAIEITLEQRVADYLSLIMTLILGFGVCFQLPVALSLLARAGFLTGDQLRTFRKYAVLAIAVAAAILSPPDPFSMLAMMAPTILLYEASIWIVDRIAKAREARQAEAGG